MENLIKAVKSLLSDIESMQSDYDTALYGVFSEGYTGEEGTSIEWPNLGISASKVRNALAEIGELPAGLVTLKSELIKGIAIQKGMYVIDTPLVEVNQNDLKGLPKLDSDGNG